MKNGTERVPRKHSKIFISLSQTLVFVCDEAQIISLIFDKDIRRLKMNRFKMTRIETGMFIVLNFSNWIQFFGHELSKSAHFWGLLSTVVLVLIRFYVSHCSSFRNLFFLFPEKSSLKVKYHSEMWWKKRTKTIGSYFPSQFKTQL